MPHAENRPQTLDIVFDAVADSTRRSILDRLRAGPITVTGLAEPYAISLNAVSKHVKKLESAGLIRREIRGREHFCQVDAAHFEMAMDWMGHYRKFWTDRMDALERHLIAKRKRGMK